MRMFMYTIKAPVGMHARHAGLLVRETEKYKSKITLVRDGRGANAKAILSLMVLGVKQGDLVQMTVEGEDEDLAATELKNFMWTHF